jgi:hypothetical protein
MGRPKLNRTVLQARVNPDTPEKLKQMALELGFQWGTEGNTGAFLDAITLRVPYGSRIFQQPKLSTWLSQNQFLKALNKPKVTDHMTIFILPL